MKIDKLVTQLKEKISEFDTDIEISEQGTVVSVSDGIVKASGLSNCMSLEMLKFSNEETGLALNLEEDEVGIIILGEYQNIKAGDTVSRTNKILEIPTGKELLGRVVNPLIRPVDGGSELEMTNFRPIEKKAPGVMTRKSVHEPLQTGFTAVDALFPIGRGQRQLIIGDRQTGKTSIAIDTIINQKDQDVICVYVAIGQKKSKVRKTVEILNKNGAMDYTTVVLAGASDPASMLYLSPYSGVTIAEHFLDQGKDVLVIYDDLSKHAVAYREMSLLLRRSPGREAFPGDVFYLHSRLLERAAKLNDEHGGGSITAFPIIETQSGDISAYVPTNVISITDGQIFLEPSLFYKGIRPAFDIGNSVSRVGGSAQIKSMKKNAGRLKLELAQFRELESFMQFDSDLDPATKSKIERGKRAIELLKQDQFAPRKVSIEVTSIYALNNGFLDDIKVSEVSKWLNELFDFMNNSKSELLSDIEESWNDEIEESLKEALTEYKAIEN